MPLFNQPQYAEGYCTPQSVFPGQTIDFHVSSSVDYSVKFLRLKGLIGISDALPANPLYLLTPQLKYPALFRAAPVGASSKGCNWPVSFTFTVPGNSRSDIYAAECTGMDGVVSYIVFIVKPPPQRRSSIAVLANTNTWNAYNDWGGNSRYTDPYTQNLETSFQRPNPYTSPFMAFTYLNPCHLTRAELWVLKWLTAAGYSVDVYADQDFHSGITDFNNYKGLILSTHPEYWTKQMFDHLVDYLGHGGKLLYLGGNGIFEEIKYDSQISRMVFLEGTPGKNRDDCYFRNLQPKPCPEREVLGVAFLYDNYHSATAPYRVENASHRFFSGTNLQNGDLIGHEGICGAASGREMDVAGKWWNIPVVGNQFAPIGVPSADTTTVVNAWVSGSDRGHPPSNIQLLAQGINERYRKVDRNSGVISTEGPHGAQMTYYDTPAGGYVLSVGSMLFGGSLVLDYDLQTIVKNALKECK